MCASRKKKGGGCEVEIIMFAKGSPRLILNLFEFSCKNELNVNIKKHQQNLYPVGFRTFDYRYSMRRSRIRGEGRDKVYSKRVQDHMYFHNKLFEFCNGDHPPHPDLTLDLRMYND